MGRLRDTREMLRSLILEVEDEGELLEGRNLVLLSLKGEGEGLLEGEGDLLGVGDDLLGVGEELLGEEGDAEELLDVDEEYAADVVAEGAVVDAKQGGHSVVERHIRGRDVAQRGIANISTLGTHNVYRPKVFEVAFLKVGRAICV